ncbi:MAG TPA: DinB family protein [Dehalococcoidia bacterium]|nr:DinB family protein [Dehalococcoidia bacterium]
MDIEYFRTLFDYNRWANARILDRSSEVAEADYFGPHPGLSFGNLHGTLVHLIGAEMTWLRRFTGQPAPRITEVEMPDLAALVALRAEAEAGQVAYFATLTDSDVNRDNTYGLPNGGQMTHKLGHQMAHWVNHATQFRSEAAVRLTELGLSPGGLDLAMWLTTR